MAPQRHRGAKGCRPPGGEGSRSRWARGVPGEGSGEVPDGPRWVQVRFQVGADGSR